MSQPCTLRQIRQALGLSQSQIAEVLKISVATIQATEEPVQYLADGFAQDPKLTAAFDRFLAMGPEGFRAELARRHRQDNGSRT